MATDRSYLDQSKSMPRGFKFSDHVRPRRKHVCSATGKVLVIKKTDARDTPLAKRQCFGAKGCKQGVFLTERVQHLHQTASLPSAPG